MKKQKTETLLHYPDFVLEEPRNGYPRVRLSRPLVLKEGDRDETLRQFLLIHRRLRSRRIRSLDFLARLPEPARAKAIAETVDLLAGSLCDTAGRWTADYVRLRFRALSR